MIAKAEHLAKGPNPRFIVTSLTASEIDGRTLYERVYCARGEIENRIKEQQLDLFADRTSAATMRANQLRLWFASFAYVLLEALRRIGLRHTQFADATCGTIRLKLLKIGAQVTARCAGSRSPWLRPARTAASSRSPICGSRPGRPAARPRRGLSRSPAPAGPAAAARRRHVPAPRPNAVRDLPSACLAVLTSPNRRSPAHRAQPPTGAAGRTYPL